MANFSAMFFTWVLVAAMSICSTNGFSLPNENQIHRLFENCNALAAKVNELEALVIRGGKSNSELAIAGDDNIERQCCTINKMPSSCQDLKEIGHVLSGFYTVKGNGVLQSVYCDFTKAVNGTGFQKLIGYNQVKTSPIFFHLKKEVALELTSSEKTISYEVEQTNVGNSIDKTTGKFTAPQAGKYFFIITGKARTSEERPSSAKGNGKAWLYLYKNNFESANKLSSSFCDDMDKDQHCTLVGQATVTLNQGDTVFARIMGEKSKLWDDSMRYTSFSGWLIEEDISGKLVSV